MRPRPSACISLSSAPRLPSADMMSPCASASASTVTCSYGSFAAPVLQQYAEMQFAAAEHDELVRIPGGFDPQCHVVDGLALQALADLAAGDEFAFPAEERRGVDLEGHADGRFVDGEARQRFGRRRIAQRVRYLGLGDSGKGHDV